jgi:hypothetical protein
MKPLVSSQHIQFSRRNLTLVLYPLNHLKGSVFLFKLFQNIDNGILNSTQLYFRNRTLNNNSSNNNSAN